MNWLLQLEARTWKPTTRHPILDDISAEHLCHGSDKVPLQVFPEGFSLQHRAALIQKKSPSLDVVVVALLACFLVTGDFPFQGNTNACQDQSHFGNVDQHLTVIFVLKEPSGCSFKQEPVAGFH